MPCYNIKIRMKKVEKINPVTECFHPREAQACTNVKIEVVYLVFFFYK
uniref:Uncharacterized protein n=1 Tax=Arundo donax TaxID=35708 RepID=A0A0A9H6R3_ARUDO